MTDPTRLEANKQNVQAFYDLMFNQNKPAEAVERFVGAEYIQHNPDVGGRQAGLHRVLRPDGCGVSRVSGSSSFALSPRTTMWCCTAGSFGPATRCTAGIDIFRLDEDGKVVEHWDVLQVVPSSAQHTNGMF